MISAAAGGTRQTSAIIQVTMLFIFASVNYECDKCPDNDDAYDSEQALCYGQGSAVDAVVEQGHS